MYAKSEIIARNAVKACLLEASSFPKPGNVWRGKRVGGLEYEDFVRAAKAVINKKWIAPWKCTA